MKTVIIGGKGLLGGALAQKFARSIALGHSDIEIKNPGNVVKVLGELKPDVVINCAANAYVDSCEANQEECFAINAGGVKNILDALKDQQTAHSGGRTDGPIFVQISSSEVFGRVNDGEYKIEGYAEDEEPKPVSAYQKSKFEAEKIVREFAEENPGVLNKWFVARAGWLYGNGRKTFVHSFLEALQKKDEVTVIKDQWRNPTWTKDFADGLENLLSGNFESGIYHIVSDVKEGEAATIEVVEEIKKFLGPKFTNPPIKLVMQKDFFKVPRAPSNVLKNTKLPRLPYWRDSLQQYLKTSR